MSRTRPAQRTPLSFQPPTQEETARADRGRANPVVGAVPQALPQFLQADQTRAMGGFVPSEVQSQTREVEGTLTRRPFYTPAFGTPVPPVAVQPSRDLPGTRMPVVVNPDTNALERDPRRSLPATPGLPAGPEPAMLQALFGPAQRDFNATRDEYMGRRGAPTTIPRGQPMLPGPVQERAPETPQEILQERQDTRAALRSGGSLNADGSIRPTRGTPLGINTLLEQRPTPRPGHTAPRSIAVPEDELLRQDTEDNARRTNLGTLLEKIRNGSVNVQEATRTASTLPNLEPAELTAWVAQADQAEQIRQAELTVEAARNGQISPQQATNYILNLRLPANLSVAYATELRGR